MGYDLHITRASDFSDSASDPIALQEWLEYVASDPELRVTGAAEVAAPDGSVLRYENEGLAVWTAPGKHQDATIWFDYRGGSIVVKNPDEKVVEKMVSIARALNARVQGDDGEYYGENDQAQQPASPADSKRWWQRLLGL